MPGPTMEIECPHCQAVFNQDAREITVKGSRTCPACQGRIEFSGGYLFKILRKMERFPGFGSRREPDREGRTNF